MRTRTALSALTLPTLWLLLAACGQTPTSAPTAQVPSTIAAATGSAQVHLQSVPGVAASDTSGRIVGWGNNTYGQLDIPALPDGMTYTAVDEGAYTTVALRSDGTIVATGARDGNQVTVPTLPSGVTYTAVAAGNYHFLALTSDGGAVAFGYDYDGDTVVPALPAGLTYTAVAGGSYHSVALRSDGTVVGWGDNYFGELDVPALPTGMTYTAITAGGASSLALRSDGQVVAWGDNYFGQLNVPALPAGLRYTAMALGETYGLALRSDGQIVGWGNNYSGQLNIPALPSGLTYTAVTANGDSSGALRSDGQILNWGYFSGTPPMAPAGSQFTAVVVGNSSGLAIVHGPPYAFKGFQAPLKAAPALNVLNAGSAFPLKFSLGGYKGLGILAAGSPTIQPYPCAAGGPSGTAGRAALGTTTGLQYSASTDTYSYVGKAAKTLLGCYQVDVKLSDGTDHLVNVLFK